MFIPEKNINGAILQISCNHGGYPELAALIEAVEFGISETGSLIAKWLSFTKPETHEKFLKERLHDGDFSAFATDTAKAILNGNPDPDDDELRSAISTGSEHVRSLTAKWLRFTDDEVYSLFVNEIDACRKRNPPRTP